MKVTEYISKQKAPFLIALAYAVVILLGIVDFQTGYEFSFSIFYLVPISTVAWLIGIRAGTLIALVSAFTWLAALVASKAPYQHTLIPYWNAIVRMGFFFIVVYLIHKLKNIYINLEELVKERTASLTKEISERQKAEEALIESSTKLKKSNSELQYALANIKTLEEILPICSYCKKIRDDRGYWSQVESYISNHTDTLFSHGICPECTEKALKEIEEFKKKSGQ